MTIQADEYTIDPPPPSIDFPAAARSMPRRLATTFAKLTPERYAAIAAEMRAVADGGTDAAKVAGHGHSGGCAAGHGDEASEPRRSSCDCRG